VKFVCFLRYVSRLTDIQRHWSQDCTPTIRPISYHPVAYCIPGFFCFTLCCTGCITIRYGIFTCTQTLTRLPAKSNAQHLLSLQVVDNTKSYVYCTWLSLLQMGRDSCFIIVKLCVWSRINLLEFWCKGQCWTVCCSWASCYIIRFCLVCYFGVFNNPDVANW